jgi:hypothetical protein
MSEFPDMNLQWRTVEVSDAHVSERIAMEIDTTKQASLLPNGYAHLPKGEVQPKTSII